MILAEAKDERTCDVDGCEKPHAARGMCGMHWARWRRRREVIDSPAPERQSGRVCDVLGCGKPHQARGLCAMHYVRLRKHGDVDHDTYWQMQWANVDRSGECWLWTGSQTPNGYGRAQRGRTSQMAHRLVYERLVGPIPSGLHLDHLCGTRVCVRPDHLEPVTQAENNRRARGAA